MNVECEHLQKEKVRIRDDIFPCIQRCNSSRCPKLAQHDSIFEIQSDANVSIPKGFNMACATINKDGMYVQENPTQRMRTLIRLPKHEERGLTDSLLTIYIAEPGEQVCSLTLQKHALMNWKVWKKYFSDGSKHFSWV
jgi:hypothetical protein